MADSWDLIFKALGGTTHDFTLSPLYLDAAIIKKAVKNQKTTGQKEVRILCKQDTRESRPKCFKDRGLFLLPVVNGKYAIIQGEGYIDLPTYTGTPINYESKLDFVLKSSKIGNSEMQYLDLAYASSVIRTFMDDPSLVLSIRGRKFTPKFTFKAGEHRQDIEVSSVQTEVDGGYEGRNQIVLVEAKNSGATNTIIRQLYYPMRQWSICGKDVKLVFFENKNNICTLSEFTFDDVNDYHSIRLGKQASYLIIDPAE